MDFDIFVVVSDRLTDILITIYSKINKYKKDSSILITDCLKSIENWLLANSKINQILNGTEFRFVGIWIVNNSIWEP